jgi:hypothetical protein
MTKTQTHILDLIAKLPIAERRELVAHVQHAGLLDETFHARMTPGQRSQLDDGIAQAERGEVVDGATAFNRIASSFGFKRA